MIHLWSNVVLFFSASSLSLIGPTPVPQFNPGLSPPFNYITFARWLGNTPDSTNPWMGPYNPAYPAQVAAAANIFNPANPLNFPHSGIPGGVNTFSSGLINAGLAISKAFGALLSGVTGTVGNILSGTFSDGFINDATLTENTIQP